MKCAISFTYSNLAGSVHVCVIFLPASIEAHLLHAGCTSTELLVLRNMLDGHAFTLRELAAKTGKSTGVLDQAMKKLMGKHVIRRELVNGAPKYAIASSASILQWLRQHTAETLGLLKRREDDLHQFLFSVESERQRPSIEYFEGAAGFERAHWQLLEAADGEVLVLTPVNAKEEEDPFHAMRERLTKERRRKNIEARSIVHDTPLGRRYQSRDIFELRKTQLIPAEWCPLSYEQVIAGAAVGCFFAESERACIVRFADLAALQRSLFNALWARSVEEQGKETAAQPISNIDTIPLSAFEIRTRDMCAV